MYKLMNNAMYGKTMKNLKKIDVKLVGKKWTSKPSYISHKVFDNNLVVMRKSKVTLKLNIPAYFGMCLLDLSIVLMYEFHHDYNKNKYDKIQDETADIDIDTDIDFFSFY